MNSKELVFNLSVAQTVFETVHTSDSQDALFNTCHAKLLNQTRTHIAALDARIEALEGERDAWQKKFGLAWHVLVYVEAASECADSRTDAKAAMEAIDALGGENGG